MSEEELIHHIQIIYQRIETLHRDIISMPRQQQLSQAIEDLAAALSNLQSLHEERQNRLEQIEVIQEELLQQNEYLAIEHQHYYNLFMYAPEAYLLTNAQGIILDANLAASELFNILPCFLINKPLINFVHKTEHEVFCTQLNQLSKINSVQEWEILMCPRDSQAFDASLRVAPVHNFCGKLVSLQIGIRNVTKYKQVNVQQLQYSAPLLLPKAATEETRYSLDGLQLLFIDDEADTRELITAVLEQQGICVTAVASVREALCILERSRPDVIVSDIRMPEEDGYALIKKIRAIEAEKGWRIPTVALTAYLTEDQAKAIKAGFQSHLHKLAPPTDLVAMVAHLAKCDETKTHNSNIVEASIMLNADNC